MADKLNDPSLVHRGSTDSGKLVDEKILAQQHVEERNPDAELIEMRNLVEGFDDKEKRKLLWKMDLHIIPILISLYLMSFIDRANIGNAKIEGMNEDLGLDEKQYSVVLSIFFVTYILFEMPSNYVLERYFRTRPSWWLGFICAAWGIFMILHGIVKDYAGIMAVRLLMGVFEAGLFPGALLFMNHWYTKFELATRFAMFYVGSAIAGAFSGLLAYAFAKMDGLQGVAGWRWIFLMEGVITVILGIAVPFLLADTPDRAKGWLSEKEKKYLKARMTLQEGGSKIQEAGSHFSWKLLWDVFSDWQFYVMVFNYWSNNIPQYGMKFTMPQIMKNMGYTSSNAQLMTIPPYVAGAISAYCFGRMSDKFRRRSVFVMIPQSLVIIGYAIIFPLAPRIKSNVGACYFSIMILNIGMYPINPGTSSWLSNNLAGSAKRALGLAFIISITNFGGIAASFMFMDSEAPAYPTGFGTSLAAPCAGVIASVALDLIYMRINKKRKAEVEELGGEEGVKAKYGADNLAKMGNRSPLFVYTL